MRRIRPLLRHAIPTFVWMTILATCGCGTLTLASHAPALLPQKETSAGASPSSVPLHRAPESKLPQHVFLIVLENESYDVTFGATSNPYLKTVAKHGVLLTYYYGIGHQSLDNYIAIISGQAPNKDTQADCPRFKEFDMPKDSRDSKGNPVLDSDGQLVGHGCVFPPDVMTIANQLDANKFTWKAYMEDMGNASHNDTRQEIGKVDQRSRCRHPRIGQQDPTFDSLSFHRRPDEDQYVTRHNPFVYFHSIVDDDKYCEDHDVPLVDPAGEGLEKDLRSLETTPNFVFISPNLCHDGHDPTPTDRKFFGRTKCRTGEEGGVRAVNTFLLEWVPKIENSPAFKKDGVLIITFDEAEDKGASFPDYSATAHERPGPNAPNPGRKGPGGGRVGAVVVSPFVKPGSSNDHGYNHYSMLRSIEDLFGLDHLGFAAQSGLETFQDGGVFD